MESTRRKSSYSNGGGGNCVAVGTSTEAVFVEDTKQDRQTARDRIAIPADAWGRFLASVK